MRNTSPATSKNRKKLHCWFWQKLKETKPTPVHLKIIAQRRSGALGWHGNNLIAMAPRPFQRMPANCERAALEGFGRSGDDMRHGRLPQRTSRRTFCSDAGREVRALH